jgi:hypothetical protein
MRFKRGWLAVAGVTAAVLSLTLNATAAPLGPVGTVSSTGTPALSSSVLNQVIRQLVQCGPTMYAVGKVTTLSQRGQTITRSNIFSFNATAPFALTSWAPAVNGTVNSIAFVGGNCTEAYIGGKFTSVGGTTAKNIAKISTSTGAVDPTFKHTATGQVETLLGVGTHLFVGGYFAKLNANTHPYFASVSPTTGVDDGYLNLGISGTYVFPGAGTNPTRVYNLQLSHAGDRMLVEGDFTSVGGQHREQIFMLDLGATTATVDGWTSDEFLTNCNGNEAFYLQDAAWSVDDSQVFTAATGYKPNGSPAGSFPRTGICDSAAAFPSTATTVSHTWINYPGCDSLYSITADASTVYIGGHERWISNPNGCDFKGPGAVVAPGMAGLSPSTGAVIWNPGRGRGKGADDMMLTDAGLWIASDNAQNTNSCAGHFDLGGICFISY